MGQTHDGPLVGACASMLPRNSARGTVHASDWGLVHLLLLSNLWLCVVDIHGYWSSHSLHGKLPMRERIGTSDPRPANIEASFSLVNS